MKKPKKETFEVLRRIDGVDTVSTVEGYSIGEHFGAQWFIHKEGGAWRVSEVKSGMSATARLTRIDESGELLYSPKGINAAADALIYAPRYLDYLHRKIGAENFFSAINKGRDKMAAAKSYIKEQK